MNLITRENNDFDHQSQLHALLKNNKATERSNTEISSFFFFVYLSKYYIDLETK